MRNCGECLFTRVEVVALHEPDGVCPSCGACYGHEMVICADCNRTHPAHENHECKEQRRANREAQRRLKKANAR